MELKLKDFTLEQMSSNVWSINFSYQGHPFCECEEQLPIREQIIQLIRLRLVTQGYALSSSFTYKKTEQP